MRITPSESSEPLRVGVDVVKFKGSGDYRLSFAERATVLAGSGRFAAIFGLLDLYQSGLDYPPHLSLDAKYVWAKQQLEESAGVIGFRQHFAVHETEAWLLSDSTVLPDRVRRKLPASVATPERVDFREPPARVLQQAFWDALGKKYKKIEDGVDLFRRLDPEKAYERCPHLKLLLDDMLELAKSR